MFTRELFYGLSLELVIEKDPSQGCPGLNGHPEMIQQSTFVFY